MQLWSHFSFLRKENKTKNNPKKSRIKQFSSGTKPAQGFGGGGVVLKPPPPPHPPKKMCILREIKKKRGLKSGF